MIDLERCKKHIQRACRPVFRGHVEIVSGVLVEAIGVPAALGELCRIHREPQSTLDAEVVGFRGTHTLLMPHGDLAGVAPGQLVTAVGRPFMVSAGTALLGRVLDGFGRAMDRGEELEGLELRSVRSEAPDPLSRAPIVEAIQTGVRAIDGLATIGRGQRMGIFAGSGVGKSSLLAQITRGTNADVVVVALVGERGREVRSFLTEALGEVGRQRSVVVAATSDRAPIERFLAPFVAVTVAEYFRDHGADVLLVMDSVTRFAGACREIGLAAGEPPTVRGYPPSFFATMPKLIERMGTTERGSITGLLTVLLDADDPNEPVGDTLRGLLDGHLYLSRELAEAGHYPAIDPLASLSRLMPSLVDESHRSAAARVRELVAAWREGRDLVEIGAYRPGTNPKLDLAVERMPVVDTFLRQAPDEVTPIEETQAMLALLAGATGEESR